MRPQRRASATLAATQAALQRRHRGDARLRDLRHGHLAGRRDPVLLELAPGTAVKVARQAVVRGHRARRGRSTTRPDGRLDDRRSRRRHRRRPGPTVPDRATSARERAIGRRRPTRSEWQWRARLPAPGAGSSSSRWSSPCSPLALGDRDPGKRATSSAGVEAEARPRPAGRHPDHASGQHDRDGEDMTPANLEEARGIIDQRVNGSGVAEAEVAHPGRATTSSSRSPARPASDLVDTVKRTAQLRFRLVAAMAPGQPQPAKPAQPERRLPAATPTRGKHERSAEREQHAERQAVGRTEGVSASPKGRAVSGGLLAADETPTPTPSPRASPRARSPGKTRRATARHRARAAAPAPAGHRAGRADQRASWPGRTTRAPVARRSSRSTPAPRRGRPQAGQRRQDQAADHL